LTVLRNLPTRVLLLIGCLAAALGPLVVVAFVSYEASRAALKAQAFRQLESARTLKKEQIERAFRERGRAVSVLVRDPYLAQAFGEICAAYREEGGAASRAFAGHDQRRFDAPAAYRAVHDRHYPYFAAYVDEQGYYDLLFVDARTGECCFSVEKETDFATAISEQPTSLGDAWRRVMAGGHVEVSDTRLYPPSANAAAQFVAAPVVTQQGVAGVVALQISIDSIDAVMRERAGMGSTGETYLVGSDGRLRSNSQLDPSRTVEAAFRGELVASDVDREASRPALAGQTGSAILRESNGRAVLAAWAPVDVGGGTTWAIVAVIGEGEIDAQIDRALSAKILAVVAGAAIVSVLLALSISLGIARAVSAASAQVSMLSDAVLAGDIGARGDPGAVSRELRDIVFRVNGLVDALVRATDEKRRLEERIGRMQRLEAIGTLAGGIAHDFNNILTSMFAYLDIIEGELPPGSKVASSLRQMDAGLERAAELVRQILTFSRQLHAKPGLVDLGEAAREALELVTVGLPANVSLVADLPKRSFPVTADVTQMHQVVVNLLINAIQAIGEAGGKVSISLAEETLRDEATHGGPALPPGNYCVVEVRDTGCGMDADTMARIFEPFFTTKPIGQGTGMGLALVHGVVTGAGGAITVESKVAWGATFRVYLPRSDRSPEPIASAGSTEAGGGRLVLFVDDEEQVCRVGSQMLTSLGYRVMTATGGKEAIELFGAHAAEIDLLLTDLSMPGVGGLDVVAAARARRPDMPIILSTAYPDALTPESAAVAEVTSILLKPYRRSALARTLVDAFASAMSGKRGPSARAPAR
jgi:signal transduction histidine kinase/ActR/RegA family two-component response regulator